MISKFNKSSVMVNCLTGSETSKGKNGKAIFKNERRKFDETEECCWREVSWFCRVKGGY